MCGIFGYVLGGDEPVPEDALTRAQTALRHRGPDAEGTFEGASRGARVGLAHTRLAIIDRSPGGAQPMTTPEGRFTLVYNGEIYNYVAIRRALEASGERFTSSSDTEVLLRAFARWGERALDDLRGMFAIAIWDKARGRLFLARDRLGKKPLYYTLTKSGVAFASEVRALCASGFADRRVNRRALTSYFTMGAVTEPATIVEGVLALPAGTWLAWEGDAITRATYWTLPLAHDGAEDLHHEARAIAPILEEAVRMRLVADVPVGVFLSGGIDSSIVAALAARASERPVHTFTVTFDEAAYDEASHADEVARRLGCDHHRVHLPADRAVGDFGATLSALDQPSVDGLNTFFVAKAARAAGLGVALSGVGGDELFAGYPMFKRSGALLRAARASRFLPAPARSALARVERMTRLPSRARKLAALLQCRGSLTAAYASLRAIFTPGEQGAILDRSIAAGASPSALVPEGLEALFLRGEIDPVNTYSALEITNYLRSTLLRDTDVMSMANGLEVRAPLLDHVLVERVMRAPGALKIRPRSGNKPLLTAAAPPLPRSVVHRKKMGFLLPCDVWFKGPLRRYLEDLLFGDATRTGGVLRRPGVEALWRSFLHGQITYPRVWCLAAFAGWCDVNRMKVG